MYSSCILFHCITFFIHGYVQAFRNIRKRNESHFPSSPHFYCSFPVSFEGSFFTCFSLNISPIAPRVPSVSIALDGIKTLFAYLLQLQLMIQMICKQVYAHPNSLHEAIQYDFVLLLQFLQLPLLPLRF